MTDEAWVGLKAELTKLAAKLKGTEECAASVIEAQACVAADARWAGRELLRLIAKVETRSIACAAPGDVAR